MKQLFYLSLMMFIMYMSCSSPEEKQAGVSTNPLLLEYNTPFGVPLFDSIKPDHYIPAYKEAIQFQIEAIDQIVRNTEVPTFENTIEAIELSGRLISKVSCIFGNLTEANTNEQLQEISKEVAPMLSKNSDDIRLNKALFDKIKAVYDKKADLKLSDEQGMMLEKYYKEFVRGGANLPVEKQDRLRKINEELSLLTLQFGDNILAENNNYKLYIENKDDLAGLPESVINSAAEDAKSDNNEGKWLFTLQKPSLIPFLQYSGKRELREKIYKGYLNRGNNNNQYDNKDIIKKIVNLRIEKANLLGYKNHAEYVLEENMAKTPEKVYEFLNKLWTPAIARAKNESKELQSLITKEGNKFKLESWDWWYYSEKLRKAKYDLNEEDLRPYFKLENVRDGMFAVAGKLYGLKFIQRNDIPKYHPDALVFEVQEADGSHVGVLFNDYFPRESKRGGAWMDNYRNEYKKDGKRIAPIVTMVCNFSKPAGDVPSLLNFDEVSTLFHEFGHALHGLLSQCSYEKTGGTAVSRDFVELPSQIMENWASQPDVLIMFAKHYQTGEVIPQELIDKIVKSSLFNKGFETVEYIAASLLDMDWHTLTQNTETEVLDFENNAIAKMGLVSEILPRYRSMYFQHIFSGGYSAGYYSYLWSEWLDADAFEAFKEKGLFDQATAKAFRENILAKGGSIDAMTMYVNFRGKEPKIEPLLKRKGMM